MMDVGRARQAAGINESIRYHLGFEGPTTECDEHPMGCPPIHEATINGHRVIWRMLPGLYITPKVGLLIRAHRLAKQGYPPSRLPALCWPAILLSAFDVLDGAPSHG